MPKKIPLYSIILVLAISAHADSPAETDLKTIMQGLRTDTSLMLDAMLVEDYDAIAGAAAKIADHPKIPPEQVAQVATELRSEMSTFKQLDTAVHDLSLAIQSAALEKDHERIVVNYQEMVRACLACHVSFRSRVSTVLNPE